VTDVASAKAVSTTVPIAPAGWPTIELSEMIVLRLSMVTS